MTTVAVAGSTFTFPVCLYKKATTTELQTPPTIALADFQRSINGGAWTNLDNTPVVTPAAGASVAVILSAAETTAAAAGGCITVKWEDALGGEWASGFADVFVHAYDVDQSGDCFPSVAVAAAYAVMTSGLAFRGTIAAIPALNQFTVTAFIGFGTGTFADTTNPYRVFVWRDNAGTSIAPQGEIQTVTAYNSATGTFTHTPFTVPLTANDTIIVMHPLIAQAMLTAANVWTYTTRTLTTGGITTITGMTSKDQNFEMYSGDTKTVTVTVLDGAGVAVDLTGCTIVWALSKYHDTTAVVTKSTAAATITILGNTFSFTLLPVDTENLIGTYYHEAEVTDLALDISTVTCGHITILEDLT